MKYSDAEVKGAIAEAQKAIVDCNGHFEGSDVDPMNLVRGGEMWQSLTASQRAVVEEAFLAHGVIGNTPDSGSGDL